MSQVRSYKLNLKDFLIDEMDWQANDGVLQLRGCDIIVGNWTQGIEATLVLALHDRRNHVQTISLSKSRIYLARRTSHYTG